MARSTSTRAPPLVAVAPPDDEAALERAADDWERHSPLRLTVARGALGLELYEPIEIGPLEVVALSLTLPGLRFPLDLSGGVPVFRNRRGELEHLELRSTVESLSRWLGQRLRDVIGPLERPVTLWALPSALGVGLVGEGALAFDLLWAPDGGDARFVVANARGACLAGPALGHALRAVDSALGGVAERRGRVVTLRNMAFSIGRALLPAIGARAPSARRVLCGPLEHDDGVLRVELDSSFAPAAVGQPVARALELAELVAEADQMLATGDVDAARAAYVAALERAPRHPELTRLIAEIDVCAGGRAEAALGLLVESLPTQQTGAVGAELLARVGDFASARDAVLGAANAELFAPLAALIWQRFAELEQGSALRLAALDRAVARAPGLAKVRWSRFEARLERGDVEGVLADAEHLEAAAIGARARHEVCRRAARGVLEAGFVREAGKLFERALRYLPDDAHATAGLARALLEAGQSDRAIMLLERAIQLSERAGRADDEALLDLARLIAAELRDLPQAIARARQIPSSSTRAIEARRLEARWRGQLGDVAGASLVYGRLREAIELENTRDPRWTEWLVEAARFERDVEKDALSAERHLALALRLSPHDREVAEAYREAASVVAALARRDREDRS